MANVEPSSELSNARSLLRRARQDFGVFRRIAGPGYLRYGKGHPNDPALAVYLLQQCVEKTVKSVAVASGRFTMEDFKSKYSHDSLALYCDFFLCVSMTPMASAIDFVATETKQPVASVGDFQARLRQIKQYTDRRHRDPRDPDWWHEFATAPPESVRLAMDYLITTRHNVLKFSHTLLKGTLRFDADQIAAYMDDPTAERFMSASSRAFRELPDEKRIESAMSLMSLLSPAATGKGFRDYLRQLAATGGGPEVQILKRGPTIDKGLLGAWASGALMFLAAYTFPHEATCRYPEDVAAKGSSKTKLLDCESYSDELGVVKWLNKVAKVTELVVQDIEDGMESVALAFRMFGPATQGP